MGWQIKLKQSTHSTFPIWTGLYRKIYPPFVQSATGRYGFTNHPTQLEDGRTRGGDPSRAVAALQIIMSSSGPALLHNLTEIVGERTLIADTRVEASEVEGPRGGRCSRGDGIQGKRDAIILRSLPIAAANGSAVRVETASYRCTVRFIHLGWCYPTKKASALKVFSVLISRKGLISCRNLCRLNFDRPGRGGPGIETVTNWDTPCGQNHPFTPPYTMGDTFRRPGVRFSLLRDTKFQTPLELVAGRKLPRPWVWPSTMVIVSWLSHQK